ncbi:hypothetical protein ACIQ9P_27060 [Kitasatospora sp. NPDC094019]|uniref:hypothetical protein n=1 Tax=Kitasatospora sp. NPDC094019 TaxID=3364091 RepID=UPI00380D9BFF
MDTEDMVRDALRDEAARVPLTDWSAGPMRDQVRRQRRGRRTALGVSAVVAVLAVAAGTTTVLSGHGGTQVVGAASQVTLRTPEGTAPEAIVAEPGQQIPLGREGWWMRLGAQEICIHDPVVYKNDPGCGGYSWQAGATEITMQYQGVSPDFKEGLYNVVYHGPGRVARMAVEFDGRSYWATPASLPGDPGYVSGFAWAPSLKASDGANPLVGVKLAAYGARGEVLASKTLTV